MTVKHLCHQIFNLCLVFVLLGSIGMSGTAHAAPAASPQATGALLPRAETLYFNGLQWGTVAGWNPYSGSMNNSLVINQGASARVPVFETPYIYNALDGQQYPLLADGPWSWNTERTEITFKLNTAAKWSDGTPVTADDVVYTWATNVKYGTSVAGNYQDFIDSIEAVDPQTVVVKAKLDDGGNVVNPLMVSAYLSDNYVIQKAWTQTLEARVGDDSNAFLNDPAEDFVASGPYTKYLSDASEVVLIRDDNYWGQDASMWGKLPAPKYLAHKIYPDNDTSLAALRAGEVDISQQFIANEQELWLTDNLPISTYYPDAPYQLSASLPTAFYNLQSYGLDQPVVRKAIAMAVNYDAIIANAMTNQSPTFSQVPRSLMNPTPAEQALYDHDAVASLQWTGKDIDGAKALLDAADIKDTDDDGYREYKGQKLTYVATCPNGWNDWMAAIEQVAAAGQAIGIDITTNYPDWGQYQTDVTNWPLPAGYDIFMMWTDNSGPTEPWGRIRHLISSEFAGTQGNWNGNWGGYNNPDADALIQKIPGETDNPTQTKADYTELTRIYLTDVPSFTLMYRPDQFHTVNESVWTGFPKSTDTATPPVPPLSLINGYSIAGLYNLNAFPFVTSIKRLDANPTSADSVRFAVTFSEPVTGVDDADFTVAQTGLTGTPAVTSVTSVDDVYTVTVDPVSGSGSLRLDVSDDDSITDADSQPLGGPGSGNGDFTGETYIVRPPAAFNKTAPVNGSSGKINSVKLSWNPSANASSYEVCYYTTNSNVCAPASAGWISNGTTSSKTLSGLSPNATYYWQVRAKNAGGTTYANGSTASFWSFRIDNTAPKVISITRLDANPTTAASVHFTVTFSEIVTGVDALDFKLVASGITGASLTSVTGSGVSRIVTASTGTGIGTLQLQLIDNDTIKDAVATPLGGVGLGNGSYLSGPKYTLDRNNQITSTAAKDGWILESSRTSSVGGTMNAVSPSLQVGDDALNKQYRSLLSFDTSSLPDNATIVRVTLKIKKSGVNSGGIDPFTTHGALLADLRKGFFGTSDALLVTDFQAAPTSVAGSFSPVTGAPGWYQLVLGAGNLTNINKLGPTQFRLRFTQEDNNDYGADFALFSSGEAAASLRPVLIVEYILP
jgi:peptide/nickel transport system substrate-binding protein